MGNISQKFQTFGWESVEVNGHDHEALRTIFTRKVGEKPILINAKTVKGKGIKMMENNPEWHHKLPFGDQLIQMLGQVK
jgi:transketolase